MEGIKPTAPHSATPSTVVHTTARRNSVDPNLYQPVVSPRRGFKPLPPRVRPIEAPAAPEEPLRRTVGTLDQKTLKAFQAAMASKPDEGRSSTLKIGLKPAHREGYSYLKGMSAQEATEGTRTPLTSPRHGGRMSPSDDVDGGDLYTREPSPLSDLLTSPDAPKDHLRMTSPPRADVPILDFQALLVQSGGLDPDSATFDPSLYIAGGKEVTIAEINKIFGDLIPEDFNKIPPHAQFGIHPFKMSPIQIARLAHSDEEQLTLGRCEIIDSVLDSILMRFDPKKLNSVILFNCPNIHKPEYLLIFENLQELCLSWCTGLATDCFERVREGCWPNLLSLDVSNTPITNSTLDALPVLPELTTVDLSHCRGIDSNALFILLKHPKLSKIIVEGANVTREAIEALQQRRYDLVVEGKPLQVTHLNLDNLRSDIEITQEASEYYPFLGTCMYELLRTANWRRLSELNEHRDWIKKFYECELRARGLPIPLIPLDTPKGWFVAERALQEYEEPNLTKVMNVLVPFLKSKGYSFGTVEDVKNRADVDCFVAFREMFLNPQILKVVTKLDLSRQELSEVPLILNKLYFTRLKEISFSNNPLIRMPDEYVDAKGRVQNFWKNCVSLEKIDFSNCELTQVSNLFYYYERHEEHEILTFQREADEKEDELAAVKRQSEKVKHEVELVYVPILPGLKFVDFSENLIESLPDMFGISPDHHSSEVVEMKFRKNDLSRVSAETLADLGTAAPIKIELDLRDNIIMPSDIALGVPANVKMITGIRAEDYLQGTMKKERRRSTVEQGEIDESKKEE